MSIEMQVVSCLQNVYMSFLCDYSSGTHSANHSQSNETRCEDQSVSIRSVKNCAIGISHVMPALGLINALKNDFLVVNSIQHFHSTQIKVAIRHLHCSLGQLCKNSCALSNIVSHCEQEYKICYYLKIHGKMMKYEEKVHD